MEFKRGLLLVFAALICFGTTAQNKATTLDTTAFRLHQRMFLAELDRRIFHKGHNPAWAAPNLPLGCWRSMNHTELAPSMADETGRIEGWFRIVIKLNNSFEGLPLSILSPPLFYLAYISVRFKETLMAMREESNKLLKVTEEKREILANQNSLLEAQVTERTQHLNHSLVTPKATRAQLIQTEKMASLGELTDGIAHELQNPLNFVNNFSEVSSELIDQLKRVKTQNPASSEADVSLAEAAAILTDIKSNIEKITHHGKRSDAIVKGMLAHSRKTVGEKQPTDLNALADEYLALAYHGMRAKDSSFNPDFKTDFDPNLPKVDVVPQDFGRVLLNLINKAFQACTERSRSAVNERSKKGEPEYKPTLTVKTQLMATGQHLIAITDNGYGIPESIKDKILQPFFTTKKGTEGTGLGLSITNDIVKAHGGELHIQTQQGSGTEFIIHLKQ